MVFLCPESPVVISVFDNVSCTRGEVNKEVRVRKKDEDLLTIGWKISLDCCFMARFSNDVKFLRRAFDIF